MTKWLLCLALLMAMMSLTAQESDSTGSEGFSMGGGFGSMVVGGNSYTQIRLMPELVFGKFGIGLDIDLLIDKDGNLRKEDWDEAEDLINKLLYIRYGHRGDPFFGKIGAFRSYSLGRGLVMNGYSNMLRYPEERQTGLQLGFGLPVWNLQVEGFTANLVENEILAGRVTAQPLEFLQIPIIKDITFGATIATDQDQTGGLLDTDDDDYPDTFDDYPYDEDYHDEVDKEISQYRIIYAEIHGDTTGFVDWWETSDYIAGRRNMSFSDLERKVATVWGVDYEVPLVTADYFKLSHYGEMAQIVDHKMGFIFPGFYAQFLIFHANLEFRAYQEDFEPAFFDQLYEANRATAYKITHENDSLEYVVITKSDLIEYNKASSGWYGRLVADLFHTVQFTVAYEDMYGDDLENGKSIWSTLQLVPGVLPVIKTLRADYSQTREEHILKYLQTPNSLITAQAGYGVSDNTEIVATYQERYEDLDSNGKIEGADETIKTTKIGVQVRF